MSIPPKKLYKYRSFSVQTLELLHTSQLYYARPQDLNDPFECKENFEFDCDLSELKKAVYDKIKAIDGEKEAKRFFGEIDNDHVHFTNDYFTPLNWDADKESFNKLCEWIYSYVFENNNYLRILSLSASCDNHLLWSHYADNHQGICIEYTIPHLDITNLGEVIYNPNSIKASELIRSLNDEQIAKNIQSKVIFSKQEAWDYEQEWRDYLNDGESSKCLFEMSAIFFGVRCPDVVISTVAQIYSNYESSMHFYRMEMPSKGRKLIYYEFDPFSNSLFFKSPLYDREREKRETQELIDSGFIDTADIINIDDL